MTTAERLEMISGAAKHFPFLGKTTSADLLELLQCELGHAESLDRLVPRGSSFVQAVAPGTILHILAGNTPAAALQSLVRGLILGSVNWLKLPSEGLPCVAEFCALLPPELSALVESKEVLPPDWLNSADAVVVFGSDETISEFEKRIRPDQIFIKHGHRISFGVIFGDIPFRSVEAATLDASAFDQLGCLSPHVYYVGGDAREYASRLAGAMAARAASHPRGNVPMEVANAIRTLREETRFRRTADDTCAVWQSENSTEWTVIYDEAPGFPATPLHRTIFVKPLPVSWEAELQDVKKHLSCAGIFPATAEHAELLATCGVSRICPLGSMQNPPWTWPQDGQQTLAPLVRWISFETS